MPGGFKEELVGKVINGMTVLSESKKESTGKLYLNMKCHCGKEKVFDKYRINKGMIKSCGCKSPRHGGTNTKLFRLWTTVKSRCYQINNDSYKYYGGKGVIVCDEWKTNFPAFRDWCESNGYKEGLSLDRINSNGNYEPSNCRFVTMKEQGRNKSNNVYLTINGRTEVLPVWSEISGVAQGTIRRRLRKGFSHEYCIKPVGSFDHRIKLFPKWSEFE